MKCEADTLLGFVLVNEPPCDKAAVYLLTGKLQPGAKLCEDHAARMKAAAPHLALQPIGAEA